jgi:hypothetical protein
VTLGSFALLLAAFLYDAVRRFRGTSDRIEQALVVWACVTLFSFVLAFTSSPILSEAPVVLGIWTLLILPSVVPRPEERERAALAEGRSGGSDGGAGEPSPTTGRRSFGRGVPPSRPPGSVS